MMLPIINEYADYQSNCTRNFLLEIDSECADPTSKMIRGFNMKHAESYDDLLGHIEGFAKLLTEEKWSKAWGGWRSLWGAPFQKCIPKLKSWMEEHGALLIKDKKVWFLSEQKTICYGVQKEGMLRGTFGIRICPEKVSIGIAHFGAKTGSWQWKRKHLKM